MSEVYEYNNESIVADVNSSNNSEEDNSLEVITQQYRQIMSESKRISSKFKNEIKILDIGDAAKLITDITVHLENLAQSDGILRRGLKKLPYFKKYVDSTEKAVRELGLEGKSVSEVMEILLESLSEKKKIVSDHVLNLIDSKEQMKILMDNLESIELKLSTTDGLADRDWETL